MARATNFLIGNGEKLISKEVIKNGGGSKQQPYTFEEAKERLSCQLENIINDISKLPDSAKPNDEAVLSVTLHPRYVSKSDHPQKFFESQSLIAIGSKPKRIKPDNWGTKSIPEDESLTDVYYIKSSISNLNHFLYTINDLPENELNKAICYFEELGIDSSEDKFQGYIEEPRDKKNILIECVLHNGASEDVLDGFFSYLSTLDNDINFEIGKVRSVGKLGFVPILTNVRNIDNIGKFSFLRVFRRMPDLRPFRPSLTRSLQDRLSALPENVLFKNFKAVIFDGGLPQGLPLPNYIKYEEINGIGPSTNEFTQHGLAVTSAYLFGHLHSMDNLQPISNVTHVRVLGERHLNPLTMDDFNLYDVVDSMVEYMEKETPDLVNISLGPECAVDDNDITYWTAKLDSYAAKKDVLITVAAGNNGDSSEIGGLNRVQIPSDGVNILSVGAANSMGENWERASYSAVGPGRNPGIIKPDLIAFGGSVNNFFRVLEFHDNGLVVNQQQGTSFAAPLVMRHAAYIKGSFGAQVTNMALRAILIHQSEMKDFGHEDVGWGKCHDDINFAITCDDHEVTVIYQDALAVGSFTRLPLPIQDIELEGAVSIKSTIISRTDIDPEYAAAYTKNGFEVAFRPNENSVRDGSEHPITKPFFPFDKVSRNSEHAMKSQGAKWECVRKDEKKLRSTSLLNPVFDLTSHHRSQGQDEKEKTPIDFVCIVTIKCEKINDLYNEVVRNYRGILNPLTPQLNIQIGL